MTPTLLVFLAGLAGSMHCVGMCGGFACAIGGDRRGPAASALRHAVYNSGRLASYCFIGAVLGHAGWLLVGPGGEASTASTAQRVLAVLSGSLMIYIGLQFLGLIGRVSGLGASIEPFARSLRQLVKAPGYAAPLAFGVINGFLPCPLVYAFAAQAAASGGPLAGVQIMAAFGLGTFPAMLAMGGLGTWLRGNASVAARPIHASFLSRPATVMRIDWRNAGVRIAGGFIVLLGLGTLARGVLPMGPA